MEEGADVAEDAEGAYVAEDAEGADASDAAADVAEGADAAADAAADVADAAADVAFPDWFTDLDAALYGDSQHDDGGSFNEGGDLGKFGPGDMQKQFEDGTKATGVGKRSVVLAGHQGGSLERPTKHVGASEIFGL